LPRTAGGRQPWTQPACAGRRPMRDHV